MISNIICSLIVVLVITIFAFVIYLEVHPQGYCLSNNLCTAKALKAKG